MYSRYTCWYERATDPPWPPCTGSHWYPWPPLTQLGSRSPRPPAVMPPLERATHTSRADGGAHGLLPKLPASTGHHRQSVANAPQRGGSASHSRWPPAHSIPYKCFCLLCAPTGRCVTPPAVPQLVAHPLTIFPDAHLPGSVGWGPGAAWYGVEEDANVKVNSERASHVGRAEGATLTHACVPMRSQTAPGGTCTVQFCL